MGVKHLRPSTTADIKVVHVTAPLKTHRLFFTTTNGSVSTIARLESFKVRESLWLCSFSEVDEL